MGGAQPLAVTMNEGVCIAVDIDERMIQRRLDTKYCMTRTDDINEAIKLATEAKEKGEPLSIALHGNTAEVLPKLLDMNFQPDVVTDQTAAHNALNGYYPKGYTFEEANNLR